MGGGGLAGEHEHRCIVAKSHVLTRRKKMHAPPNGSPLKLEPLVDRLLRFAEEVAGEIHRPPSDAAPSDRLIIIA